MRKGKKQSREEPVREAPADDRLVVYTVLLGDKEALGSPLALLDESHTTDLEIDYVCFTDNRSLVSDTWTFVYLDDGYLPPERLSRRPKALAHEYLADWKYSLYIDNIVTFKRLPNRQDLVTDNGYLFKVYRHAFRENLYQEADAIAMLGYDGIEVLGQQMDFYDSLGDMGGIKPIHTCTVMFREHHHPSVIKHGTFWWENFLCFSKRDQMSFDFAVWKTDCVVEPLPGFKHENDFVEAINNAHDNRVKANFDAVKYAWLHRDIPEAVSNPRAHFLQNESAYGERYAAKKRIFEYVCNRYKSSMGSVAAPRRSIAWEIEKLLDRWSETSSRCLLARFVDEANELAVTSDELVRAGTALAVRYNTWTINMLELGVAEARETTPLTLRDAGRFDVALILGVPPGSVAGACRRFATLMNSARGGLVVLVSGDGQLAQIDQIHQELSRRTISRCTVSVSYSSHDGSDRPLANSLACFYWGV